ncbi:hypothetical protein H4Q26_000956 [Puccinia striiformis f. sp. tritici PST-130]|nr:hypothetical protein H4Q26_000956 [Puccinia striiformis f. sp. tritici PST-130]
MWQGLSTTSPDPMANCYEQRIRQLEETVRLLLARSRVTWPPLVSSAAQAGLFCYSVDQGLVPLLSEEMIRSNQLLVNLGPLLQPLFTKKQTRPASSTTIQLSASVPCAIPFLRSAAAFLSPYINNLQLHSCQAWKRESHRYHDRSRDITQCPSTASLYSHLDSLIRREAQSLSDEPWTTTLNPQTALESDTAATFPADSMAKLITPAPTLDRVNCLDSPSPTIVPNTPQCPPTADSTVSSLVSATPWGFSSSSDRSTDTRSRSRSSSLQLTRRQSSSLLKSEHPTTSVLASAPSSTTDNSRSHLEFAVTTVTCIEGTASGVLDPSPGLIDPNDVHSSVVTNFTQHDIQSGDVLCATPSTECSTTLSESICATIWEGYDSDPFCLSVRTILPLRNDCTKVNGLLFLNNRLVIPADAKLRRSLIAKTHRRLGHLDHLDTATDLCQEFFWPHMTDEVEQFVRDCKTCQWMNTDPDASTINE